MNEPIAPGRGPRNHQTWILPARELTLVCGHSNIGRLAHYFLPHVLLAGRQVLYLDGANRFDPLLIARFARDRSLAPAEFNRLIRIARAFACFQLTELLRRVREFLRTFPVDLLIVTALPDLYFDEDVRERQAATAFESALEGLQQLMHSQLAIGVFSDALSFNTPRRKFFQKLTAQENSVPKIETQADHHLTLQNVKEEPRLSS